MGCKFLFTSPSKSKQDINNDIVSPLNFNSSSKINLPLNSHFFKILQNDDPSLPILSVIVTIFSGTSYDNLFHQVQQVAPGGRISLYSLDLGFVNTFFEELKKLELSQSNEDMKSFADEIKNLSPDAILFNFECCSGCSYHFPHPLETIAMITYLMEKGHMVMCSDFAVKSLIKDWQESLGPNPFVNLGECSSHLELFFEPAILQKSASKQLQMVGELCENGTTTLNVLGGTVIFGMNKLKADNNTYKTNVLTIVTKMPDYPIIPNNDNLWEINERIGTIGHVLLKYPKGGTLLLSAGHWIELSNLNANVDNLEAVAKKNYGENNEYQMEIDEIRGLNSELEREERVQKMANKFVQQTTSCNYSSSYKK